MHTKNECMIFRFYDGNRISCPRGVNDTLLAVYPTRIVFDKVGMGKVFFSLAYRIWVRVRKNFH